MSEVPCLAEAEDPDNFQSTGAWLWSSSILLPFKSNHYSQKYWGIEDDVVDWEEEFWEENCINFTFIVKRPIKFWNKYKQRLVWTLFDPWMFGWNSTQYFEFDFGKNGSLEKYPINQMLFMYPKSYFDLTQWNLNTWNLKAKYIH